MADEIETGAKLSLIATIAKKLPDIPIKEGQMVFVKDKHTIALDLNGTRTFYNQIIELDTELDRLLAEPTNGEFYFVIETAVLWSYKNGWVQVSASPDNIVFIDTEMPQLGVPKKLYVDKKTGSISIWDEQTNQFIIVGEKNKDINSISKRDIENLFTY